MEEIEAVKRELEAVKKEISALSAETLALQFIIVNLSSRIGVAIPAISGEIVQAFDSAANIAENLSIVSGRKAAHVPETLRIVEELRTALVGKDKPKHGV